MVYTASPVHCSCTAPVFLKSHFHLQSEDGSRMRAHTYDVYVVLQFLGGKSASFQVRWNISLGSAGKVLIWCRLLNK